MKSPNILKRSFVNQLFFHGWNIWLTMFLYVCRICSWVTESQISLSPFIRGSTVRDQEHHLTQVPSLAMWDIIWTSRLQSLEIFPQYNQQPQWCVRSSTRIRTVSPPLWSAVVGTHTRAIRFTQSTQVVSSRRVTGPCQVQVAPLSMVMWTLTSVRAWPATRPRISSRAASHSHASVTPHLAELSES